MKKNIFITAITASILLSTQGVFAMDSSESAIKHTIQAYEKALNGSDVNAVLSVYARDGVFMPSQKPTASGHSQIKTAYEHVFSDLDLNVIFHYDDIEQDGKIAYVRTTSKGDITLLKKGVTIKDDVHRELFVLKNESGKWKITQYMFNKPKGH